ncbi:MAG: serine hydroxymethyltransferase [bacterium]|nr:serine hydroxymethyltransferase [bacterium]
MRDFAERVQFIQRQDPEVADLLIREQERQELVIRLIASENYVSRAVMEATGSCLTNKYSEGYPGKRYYQGQEFVDKIELLAIERAKALFGAEHVNVQPYSGSPANLAAYYALAEPGDTILGMSLPHGGHLTHGWKVNFSARFYHAVQYPIRPDTCLIDYDEVARLAREHKPKIIVCGASAYPRIIDFTRFAEIAHEVGASLVADIAHIAGLVVAGVHPSPVPVADVVTTTTHKSLRGPRGAIILCRAQYAKSIDTAVFPALQGGPHNHTTAAMAVAFREASTPAFKAYGRAIIENARTLAAELMSYGFTLVTGGTDNHLMLVDLSNKRIPGKPMARALEQAGIICNCNSVPFDTRPPFDPSGIRLGVCAVTTRGFGPDEMRLIARWIHEVAEHHDDPARLASIRAAVRELCLAKPVPDVFV